MVTRANKEHMEEEESKVILLLVESGHADQMSSPLLSVTKEL